MTKVKLTTSLGDVILALDEDKAPNTVRNFLSYVDEGFYDGTIFHRVIRGFMVQGGGFTQDFVQKKTHASIKNEAAKGAPNQRGTIAMARTSDPHSATCQFFINTVDNGFLNFTAPTPDGFGYCVFGKVVDGMDVVDAIERAKTGRRGYYSDVPLESIVIIKAQRCDDTEEK